MPSLNIGLIGTGFMGRAHSNAYRQADKFFPHTMILASPLGMPLRS